MGRLCQSRSANWVGPTGGETIVGRKNTSGDTTALSPFKLNRGIQQRVFIDHKLKKFKIVYSLAKRAIFMRKDT